jgi:hypothetical protein
MLGSVVLNASGPTPYSPSAPVTICRGFFRVSALLGGHSYPPPRWSARWVRPSKRGAADGLMLGVMANPPRRFPPPWNIDEMNDACFIVRDKNGQALGYFYFEKEPGRDQRRGAADRRQHRQAARSAKTLGQSLGRLPTLHERITLPRILHQMDHPLLAA